MIDIHCHILPFIDDGPQTMEESISMARMAAQEGVEKIVAAPHFRMGIYEPTKEEILFRTMELSDALKQAGIPIQLVPAMNVRIEFNLLDRLMAGDIITIGSKNGCKNPSPSIEAANVSSLLASKAVSSPSSDTNAYLSGERRFNKDVRPLNNTVRKGPLPVSYILLELPGDRILPQVDSLLQSCVFKRYIPIISHPERVMEMQDNLDRLGRWVEMGVLVQVSAMGLAGGFGKNAQRTVKRMMSRRLCHLIASEAHSSKKHLPSLSRAIEIAARMAGKEASLAMVNELPSKILAGEPVYPPEPIDQTRRWWRRG